jgi:hypothetical protein
MVGHAQNIGLRTVDRTLITKLADDVRRSAFFHKRADAKNNLCLLDLFVKKYPDHVSDTDIRTALGRRAAVTGEVKRFRERIATTFLRDRSLWPNQQVLLVPEGQPWCLDVDYISQVLPAIWKFWFQQTVRLGPQNDRLLPINARASGHQPEARNHLIIFSEPVFFFSKAMGAYIRLLDVNCEDRIDRTANDDLVKKAERNIRARLPRNLRSQVQSLGLVPVRHYLPAGDAYGASEVRGWFRSAMAEMGNTSGEAPEYREASQVAPDDYQKNLVVLGSRSSLKLFSDFQKEHPELSVKLTDEGIELHKELLKDEVGAEGFKVAHATVTMWVFDEGNAHTYIVSNHTRATSAVASTLLNKEQMKKIANSILVDGRIPGRFQLAFKVDLGLHDKHASVPILLDTIKNY